MKYQLDYTTAISRDLKRIKNRGYDIGRLKKVKLTSCFCSAII